MKRFFLSIFTLGVGIAASAQNHDELMVEPAKTTAGSAVTMYIMLNNPSTEDAVQNMQFDILWPEGWNIAAISTTANKVCGRFSNKGLVYDEEKEEDVEKNVPYFDITGNVSANNKGTYIYYSKTKEPLKGKTGYIGSVRITPPVGTPDGIYPIYLKTNPSGTFMATSSKPADRYDFADATSYVVVGNPTNASLTMEGEIPSFVNEKLATETAITSLNLSAVTKVNGTFTYVDGRAVTAPTGADVKADKAVYSRTVGAGNYASLKAPFAATGCSNLYTLDNNSDNLGSEWVNFTEAATVTAGDNLLVKGDIALSAENVALGDVAAAHAENDVYYVKNGIFYHGNSITINPLRACWKLQGVNVNLMIAINGEPTGIKLSTVDSLDTPTYDLQGRRSEKAQHGIFVTNGKKQIIK